jgi:hypothetical protein
MTGFLTTALLTVVVHNTDANRTLHRLRTTDPLVLAVIGAGQRRSPTFAALVEVVEQSDALVYVVRAHTLPHGMDGCLVLDGDGSPIRYLKVVLAMGTPADRMIVVLAHELQHVREVLEAGIPIDRAAMEGLFKRIGSRQRGSETGEQYETAAAQQVTAVVVRELRTPPRPGQP